MIEETRQALEDFTQRYLTCWQQQTGHLPASQDLHGVASPCIVASHHDEVWWQPQPFTLTTDLQAVEQALDIQLQPAVAAFYTAQFAGDMTGTYDGLALSLIQVWSEEDFRRVQENLIGHLVMKRRLKHSPTLFIATTSSELDVIAICNLSGEVIRETLGTREKQTLAPSLDIFLRNLRPTISSL